MKKRFSDDKVVNFFIYIYFIFWGYLGVMLLICYDDIWFCFYALIILINILLIPWYTIGKSHFLLAKTPEEAARKANSYKSLELLSTLISNNSAAVFFRYEDKIALLFADYIAEKKKWRGIFHMREVKIPGFPKGTQNLSVWIYGKMKVFVLYRQSANEPIIPISDSSGTSFETIVLENGPESKPYRFSFGCSYLLTMEAQKIQIGDEVYELKS